LFIQRYFRATRLDAKKSEAMRMLLIAHRREVTRSDEKHKNRLLLYIYLSCSWELFWRINFLTSSKKVVN